MTTISTDLARLHMTAFALSDFLLEEADANVLIYGGIETVHSYMTWSNGGLERQKYGTFWS